MEKGGGIGRGDREKELNDEKTGIFFGAFSFFIGCVKQKLY